MACPAENHSGSLTPNPNPNPPPAGPTVSQDSPHDMDHHKSTAHRPQPEKTGTAIRRLFRVEFRHPVTASRTPANLLD
ncbi:hypothetical protein ACO22_00443 [Paracoccidioides brasiliensis]|uniref:Uncharacterized protein n=1 Tax=Paracoccidioides brasiliensis TaxID=121759 RepID=A0A1D2JPJ9_PARBR|nr:hypothetical protein ACO22_00443 [Paracoccidioides brasiliensis]